MAKKYTHEEMCERIKNLYDGNYRLTSIFTATKDPATLIHLPCNEIIRVNRLKDFLERYTGRCKKCYPTKTGSSTKKITEEVLKDRFKNELNNEYSYISGFTTMDKKCLVRHNVCGHEWQVSPKMMLGVKKSRCPICSNKNRGKYAIKHNYLENILSETVDGNEYQWVDKYKNNNKLLHKIKHIKCGYEYDVRPNDFQQGYRCPECSKKISQSAKSLFIQNILNESCINYTIEKKFKNCKNIKELPFDFFLRDFDIPYIIEFDGSQHFRKSYGDNVFKRIKRNDDIKNQFCYKHKVNFIRLHYKLTQNEIQEILDELFKFKKLSHKTINKYNLLVKQDKKIYNKEKYYTNLNENYFIE